MIRVDFSYSDNFVLLFQTSPDMLARSLRQQETTTYEEVKSTSQQVVGGGISKYEDVDVQATKGYYRIRDTLFGRTKQ